jgi:hypothetical protein
MKREHPPSFQTLDGAAEKQPGANFPLPEFGSVEDISSGL